MEILYKRNSEIRSVLLPFEVHVHVNPSPKIVEVAHKVYTGLLVIAARAAKSNKTGADKSKVVGSTEDSANPNVGNATTAEGSVNVDWHLQKVNLGSSSVVCFIHSRRGDKLLPGYAGRDQTAQATTPEAVVAVVSAARPRCGVVYLATNEWDLNFYAESEAIKQSPVQFRQFHDFQITREMMLRCKEVKWPSKLQHLNLYHANEGWHTAPDTAADPRAAWVREKQRRLKKARTISAAITKLPSQLPFVSEMLDAGLREASDAYRKASASNRLDPSFADRTFTRCESVMLYGVEQALALFVDKAHRLHTANTRSNAPSLESDLKANKMKTRNGMHTITEDGMKVGVASNGDPSRRLDQRVPRQCTQASSEKRSGINGFERAALFNTCDPNAAALQHSTDIVYSPEHGFAYYDNVKAGSSTIRKKLQRGLQANWYVHSPDKIEQMVAKSKLLTGVDAHAIKRQAKQRTKSTAFRFPHGISDPNAFVFSFVRDPVAKFESGCRQAWFQNPDLEHAYSSADEVLDAQLALPPGKWLNEHLQPSTWRLTGWTGDGYSNVAATANGRKLDYIGALEAFGSDWPAAVGHMANLTAVQVRKLASQLSEAKNSRSSKLPRVSRRGGDGGAGGGGGADGGGGGGTPQRSSSARNNRESLTVGGILKMCRSEQYRDEWRCLGYPSPCSVHTAPLCEQ